MATGENRGEWAGKAAKGEGRVSAVAGGNKGKWVGRWVAAGGMPMAPKGRATTLQQTHLPRDTSFVSV